MKKYYKTYLISLLISVFFILFPWLLGETGVISLIYVLSLYAPISAVIAVILSLVYIIRKTSSYKSRIIMFLLNPSVYYLVILLIILLALRQEKWTGYDRLIP